MKGPSVPLRSALIRSPLSVALVSSYGDDYLTVGVTARSVVVFALAERPQLSLVSHLQDGGGSFNLTSREEFARSL